MCVGLIQSDKGLKSKNWGFPEKKIFYLNTVQRKEELMSEVGLHSYADFQTGIIVSWFKLSISISNNLELILLLT